MPLWNYRAHSKGDTMGRRSHTRDAHCQRYCFHHAFTMHGPPCENRQEMRCHSGVVEQTARRRGVKNRSSNRQQKRILDLSRTLRPQPETLFSSHTDRQRTTLKKWSKNMKALRRCGANSQGEADVKNRPHARHQEHILDFSCSMRPRPAILFSLDTDHN